MIYKESERRRAVLQRDELFGDPGSGKYKGLPRPFVLSNPKLNLFEGVRDGALAYFHQHGIKWWSGKPKEPTGHLLSSQVACVNHLYPLHDRQDLATLVLRSLEPSVVSAAKVDQGYVEFEFTGREQFLPERSFTRGANCTSVDAAMVGTLQSGERCLFLIEWKYTESYPATDKYIQARADVYDSFIRAPDSPFIVGIEPRAYYYEPFYQLMRQTLLGWLLTKHGDHGCTVYRHVHVVPEQNLQLLNRVTSPQFTCYGTRLAEVWRNVLVKPNLYISVSPEQLLAPVVGAAGLPQLMSYLKARYWPCEAAAEQ